MSKLPANIQGILWMLAATAAYAILLAVAKLLGGNADPSQINFFRALICLLVTFPVVSRNRHTAFKIKNLWSVVGLSLLATIVMYGNIYAAMHLRLNESTMLSFSKPLFIMLLAGLFLREKIDSSRLIALALGFIGVSVIIAPYGMQFSLAMAAALVAVLIGAQTDIFTKRMLNATHPLALLFYLSVFVALFNLPIAIAKWHPLSLHSVISLITLSLLGVVSQYCTFKAISVGELSVVSSVKYSRLVIAGVLAFLLFGEVPTQSELLGSLLIITGTIYLGLHEYRVSTDKKKDSLNAVKTTTPMMINSA